MSPLGSFAIQARATTDGAGPTPPLTTNVLMIGGVGTSVVVVVVVGPVGWGTHATATAPTASTATVITCRGRIICMSGPLNAFRTGYRSTGDLDPVNGVRHGQALRLRGKLWP